MASWTRRGPVPSTICTKLLLSAFSAACLLGNAPVAYADVCITEGPSNSCFAHGADALLVHEGIAVVTDAGRSTELQAENYRPKAIRSFYISAEMLREPSEEEWEEIEKELRVRARRSHCSSYAGGIIQESGSLRFIDAGGVIETRVYLRTSDPEGGTRTRTLMELTVESCGAKLVPFPRRIRIETGSSEAGDTSHNGGFNMGSVGDE